MNASIHHVLTTQLKSASFCNLDLTCYKLVRFTLIWKDKTYRAFLECCAVLERAVLVRMSASASCSTKKEESPAQVYHDRT